MSPAALKCLPWPSVFHCFSRAILSSAASISFRHRIFFQKESSKILRTILSMPFCNRIGSKELWSNVCLFSLRIGPISSSESAASMMSCKRRHSKGSNLEGDPTGKLSSFRGSKMVSASSHVSLAFSRKSFTILPSISTDSRRSVYCFCSYVEAPTLSSINLSKESLADAEVGDDEPASSRSEKDASAREEGRKVD